jgi:hypothetical protein
MSQQKSYRTGWTFPQGLDPALQRLAFKLLGKFLADGGRVRVGQNRQAFRPLAFCIINREAQ